jgi:DUF971 family protein
MIATQLKLENRNEFSLLWDDGHKCIIPLRMLRDQCPCAGCQGETILLKTYKPEIQPELPGKYTLKGAAQVGNYALQFTWGDGHNTGIYTWVNLRSLCSCDDRLGKMK